MAIRTPYTISPTGDARPSALTQCLYCGTHQYSCPCVKGEITRCCHCTAKLSRHHGDSLRKTLAFSISALLLYIPANIYPVIRLELWGHVQENTIWSSITSLAESNMFFIAFIVLLASIVVPLVKILGMIILCMTAHSHRYTKQRAWLYYIIDKTGHWSMLDIFLVAVLVALLKLGDLAYAVPGTGLIYFTLMVICTMFASGSFDPKIIWVKKNG